MACETLTGGDFWNRYWSELRLPAIITKSSSLYLAEITDVFDRHFPRGEMSVLEIGGAPGQYLAYLARTFGCTVTALDSSAVGCEKTRQNFALLGIPGTVIE